MALLAWAQTTAVVLLYHTEMQMLLHACLESNSKQAQGLAVRAACLGRSLGRPDSLVSSIALKNSSRTGAG